MNETELKVTVAALVGAIDRGDDAGVKAAAVSLITAALGALILSAQALESIDTRLQRIVLELAKPRQE